MQRAQGELVSGDDLDERPLEQISSTRSSSWSRPEVAAPRLAPRSASRSIITRAVGVAEKSRSNPLALMGVALGLDEGAQVLAV
ncbi:MAG: hypothetical protein U0359_29155 [Byssovorax sp.]